MKRLVALLFAFVLGACGVSAQTSAPIIKFDTLEYNFGDIAHKSEQVRCEFEFTNVGTAPLVFIKSTTSCTCTKVEMPRKPVMPGAKGKVAVIYEPNKKESGVFYKAIDIYTNTSEKRHTLIVKGRAI
jgi:hypothetical protein